MENRKGSGIFLSVIGVATLVVAIIGATFAYFSATAASNNDAVSVGSTELYLGYKDNINGLKTNMIPSTFAIANYAAFDETWTDTSKQVTVVTEYEADGETPKTTQTIQAPGACIDQNGNEICSVYEFYVGNPSKTTNMDVEASITVTTNEFTNLTYSIYDEAGNEVVAKKKFPTTGGSERLTALDQTLIAFADVDKKADTTFNENDPSTYNPAVDKSDSDNATASTNVRHYTMLIWINEIDDDQTDEDAGKIFTAGVSFKTGGAAGGVTGIIAVADAA